MEAFRVEYHSYAFVEGSDEPIEMPVEPVSMWRCSNCVAYQVVTTIRKEYEVV